MVSRQISSSEENSKKNKTPNNFFLNIINMSAFKTKKRHVYSNSDQISRSHEKHMQQLRKEHSKKLKLLQHQHSLHIKSIRQSYMVKIQQLNDRPEKTEQTEAEITTLRAAMEQELAIANAKFEDHVAQLGKSTQELEESEATREQLRVEHNNITKQYEVSRKEQEKTQKDLSGTQSELNTMKSQYQSNLHDLQNALAASQNQLQADYELITALKKDKSRYAAELDKLGSKLNHSEAGVRECTLDKKELMDQMQNAKIDVTRYKQEMQKLVQAEKTQSENIARIRRDIETYQEKLEQSKLAIAQTQGEMEQEKSKHIALRKEYQNHIDRLAAVNEALEKCKAKNTSHQQIIKEMHERYESLKSRSDQMIDEMQKLKQENSGLMAEREKLQNVQRSLEESRVQMEHKIKELEASSHQTSRVLEDCQRKGEACLKKSEAQAQYSEKLEGEIKASLQVLKNEDLLKRKVQALDDSATVREKEMEELRVQVAHMKEDNRTMKNHISEFESHHTADEKFQQVHKGLKDKHSKTLSWVDELKRQHEQLYKNHNALQQQVLDTDKKLHLKEEELQKSASKLQQYDRQTAELQAKIDKCLYPGQKEIMESQLRDLLRERTRMQEQMQKGTTDMGELNEKMRILKKENEDLKIIKTRYEMETQQMQKIVEQSAQLNADLINSRKMMQKKDQQLELLSSQLGTLIHRVKTLEERETMLQEKLKYSSSPEETEALTTNLTHCKLEMKKNVAKFQEMAKISERLQEQNQMNQTKVGTLMKILTDTELAREQLQAEQTQKSDLRKALLQCGEERKITTQELEQRIHAVENQYQHSLVQHERVMAESNARIQDLQNRLQQAVQMERNTRLKPDTMEPMTRKETSQMRETDYDKIIQNLKKQLAEVEYAKKHQGMKPEVAIQTANLPAVKDLQNAKKGHEQAMRDKEKQIMGTRQDTYEQLLKTLEVANKNPNTSPDDLYSQIKQIRSQGAAREQQATADMLELRAINAKLESEYKAARAAQAELLAGANTTQRNRIIQSTQQGPKEVMASVNEYKALTGAHQAYLQSQKDDVQRQLDYQRQYIKELERQAPLMSSITNQMNLQKFPDLNVFNAQVGKESYYAMNALQRENRDLQSQDRTASALEAQIRGLTAQTMMMSESAKAFGKNPTSANANVMASLAQKSPHQISEAFMRQDALKDNSQLRTTAVIGPRDPQLGPPGNTMAADVVKAEIVFKGQNGQTNKYLFDRVLLGGNESPQMSFAPNMQRAESALSEGHSYIAITYGFNAHDAHGIKYQVFKHAVQLLYPKIRQLQGDNKIQVVRLAEDYKRYDMLNPNNKLQDRCTYNNCGATILDIKKDATVDAILEKVKYDMENEQKPSMDHIVVTISSTESAAKIHIVDVLFHPTSDVSEMTDLKLLDNSWITYLQEVISNDPATKIDLFANLIAYKNGDEISRIGNQNILQIAERIKDFLMRIKEK